MTLKHLAAAALATACIFAPLQYAHADVKAYIDGIGAAKCSQLTASLKAEPSATANNLLGWSYGYMTRRNIERAGAGQSQVDLTKGFDEQKMLNIISGFCVDEPEARVVSVVDALFEVLLKNGSLTS
ncbi:MAG: hypothetical protein K8S25_16355 [Alphaproteobacteria bacterium]|nr:hypothetical protein [Alphaproteobacteria bacterium]